MFDISTQDVPECTSMCAKIPAASALRASALAISTLLLSACAHGTPGWQIFPAGPTLLLGRQSRYPERRGVCSAAVPTTSVARLVADTDEPAARVADDGYLVRAECPEPKPKDPAAGERSENRNGAASS
jgi:hypothetical protein